MTEPTPKPRATLSGRPPESLTEPGAPAPIDPATGMHRDYWVLPDEERAKGFVRPVRRSYKHVGVPRPSNLRDLTAEEAERHGSFGYVKFESYGPEREPVTGRFWTQAQLDGLGGCGTVTTMGQVLAETYARQPDFYGATFCANCAKHLPVGEQGEFTWEPDGSRVGT